ncbi:hypothetical protein SAMN05421823_104561 [Catalinimonas alkaloidigena]|uniref:Uncharacterized protein n=1 Tax=Catalinimonas alkaloidigena TaxID=1075417 RepID=A0A1G9HWG4_9BACT|nr:hypothetical protein SAMN05421823_104561 [Catalinimonas alkaloidigena]
MPRTPLLAPVGWERTNRLNLSHVALLYRFDY